MSRMLVTSIGPGSSVQDFGRTGAQRYGLTTSGAMDRFSLAIANTLVGNDTGAAAIEIGPLGAVLTAQDGAMRIAIAGADRIATIAGRAIPRDTTAIVAEGESLTLGPARSGVFSYLAIAGGISGEKVFGSLSVNARAGLGSPYPRPLQAGDELKVRDAELWPHELTLTAAPLETGAIRIVFGPQDDEFEDDAKTRLVSSDWQVSATSDRMGYRLEGPPLAHKYGHNIVSDGTVNGSIQVPGSGHPIVLTADRGTSGGYPKIATVITADLGRFGQLPPGVPFRFRAVTMAEAQKAARTAATWFESLRGLLREAGTSDLNVAALAVANVAGVAVSAVDSRTWQTPVTGEP